MPTSILRDEIQRLLRDEAAQLVDVLPRGDYDDEHIAGALSIPLKRLDGESTSRLEKGRPVIVY